MGYSGRLLFCYCVLLVLLAAQSAIQQSASEYVPLNSMTITSLYKDGEDGLKAQKPGYEPWWSGLQRMRRRRPGAATVERLKDLAKAADKLVTAFEKSQQTQSYSDTDLRAAIVSVLHQHLSEKRFHVSDHKLKREFLGKLKTSSVQGDEFGLQDIPEDKRKFLVELVRRVLTSRGYGQEDEEEVDDVNEDDDLDDEDEEEEFETTTLSSKDYYPQINFIASTTTTTKKPTTTSPSNFKIFKRKMTSPKTTVVPKANLVLRPVVTRVMTSIPRTTSPITPSTKQKSISASVSVVRKKRPTTPTRPIATATTRRTATESPSQISSPADKDISTLDIIKSNKRKVNGVTFHDLLKKTTSNAKTTAKPNIIWLSVTTASATPSTTTDPVHLGLRKKRPHMDGQDSSQKLVSPFLFRNPLSQSAQFHFRRVSKIKSPASQENVTNSFLEASPFMDVDGDGGQHQPEEDALPGYNEYLKIKVVESPFLVNMDKEGKGKLLEAKISTIPSVITPYDPQKVPKLFHPSKLTELMRDSSNYFTQLAQYNRGKKKQQITVVRQNDDEAGDDAEVIQSDLQKSTNAIKAAPVISTKVEQHRKKFFTMLKKNLISNETFSDAEEPEQDVPEQPQRQDEEKEKEDTDDLEEIETTSDETPTADENFNERVSTDIDMAPVQDCGTPSQASPSAGTTTSFSFDWRQQEIPKFSLSKFQVPTFLRPEQTTDVSFRVGVPSVLDFPSMTTTERSAHIPGVPVDRSPWDVPKRRLQQADGGLKPPGAIASLFADKGGVLTKDGHLQSSDNIRSSGPIDLPMSLKLHGNLEAYLKKYERRGTEKKSQSLSSSDWRRRKKPTFPWTREPRPTEKPFWQKGVPTFRTPPTRKHYLIPTKSILTKKKGEERRDQVRWKDIEARSKTSRLGLVLSDDSPAEAVTTESSEASTDKIVELKKQNKLLIELLQKAFGSVVPPTSRKKSSSSLSPPLRRKAPTIRAAMSTSGVSPTTAKSISKLSSNDFSRFPSPPVIYPLQPVGPLSQWEARRKQKDEEKFIILKPQSLPLPNLANKRSRPASKNRNAYYYSSF